jgi:hypothetical protein
MATNINTILNWFKTGFKPTQAQFWATWASFWHKDEQIPQNNISGLESALNEKAEKAQFDVHLSNKKAHSELFDKKADSIHTHEIVDIRGLEKTLNEKALIKHKHEIVDIQGLGSTLDEKASITHTHDIMDIKELESALNEKALLSHKHAIADIKELESALNEKALIKHKHEITHVEGLEKTLNEKALLSHTHEITDIQGLKDQLNTKLTATLATDAETQIDTNVSEDNKVISRLKLFNWWEWIKKQPLTLSNKLALSSGNTSTPALIIPNGILTTVPQNGAIERDSSGNLHHVVSSSRYRLLDDRDYSNMLTATWKSKTSFGPWIPSRNDVDFTKMDEVSIPSTTLGNGGNKGIYLFKTTDEYLIKNGSYASGKTPPKGILFEAFLKGNNCTFSGNPAIRLYSVLRTDIDTWMNYRSYEVPLVCYLGQSSGKYFSIINFSEKTHDNLGNVTSETFKKYYLYALDGSGIYFSNASISVQYRITVLYEDSQNSLGLNSTANPSFSNMSTLFLKIQ